MGDPGNVHGTLGPEGALAALRDIQAGNMSRVPDYIDAPEVSELTGIPVLTLTWYRATDQGPRSVKIGRRVRYHRADVLDLSLIHI